MQEEAFLVHPSKVLLSPSSLSPPQQRLPPGYHYNIKWPLGGPPSPQRLEEGACWSVSGLCWPAAWDPRPRPSDWGSPWRGALRVPSTRHPRLGWGEALRRQVDGRALGPSGESAGEPGERCLDGPHTGKTRNEGRLQAAPRRPAAGAAPSRWQGRRGLARLTPAPGPTERP